MAFLGLMLTLALTGAALWIIGSLMQFVEGLKERDGERPPRVEHYTRKYVAYYIAGLATAYGIWIVMTKVGS